MKGISASRDKRGGAEIKARKHKVENSRGDGNKEKRKDVRWYSEDESERTRKEMSGGHVLEISLIPACPSIKENLY